MPGGGSRLNRLVARCRASASTNFGSTASTIGRRQERLEVEKALQVGELDAGALEPQGPRRRAMDAVFPSELRLRPRVARSIALSPSTGPAPAGGRSVTKACVIDSRPPSRTRPRTINVCPAQSVVTGPRSSRISRVQFEIANRDPGLHGEPAPLPTEPQGQRDSRARAEESRLAVQQLPSGLQAKNAAHVPAASG